MAEDTFLDHVRWTNEGLVPAIAQDHKTGKILMMAWMNKEALALTVAENIAVYWSRSRKALWRKGESSGHTQRVKAIQLDCDGDTIVLQVEQVGGIACHTGRQSCFFRHLENKHWVEAEPVLKDPKDMYA